MSLQPILAGAHHLAEVTVQVGAGHSLVGRDLLLCQLLLVVLALQVSLICLIERNINGRIKNRMIITHNKMKGFLVKDQASVDPPIFCFKVGQFPVRKFLLVLTNF